MMMTTRATINVCAQSYSVRHIIRESTRQPEDEGAENYEGMKLIRGQAVDHHYVDYVE